VARVCSSRGKTEVPLSCTPCRGGSRPERIVECDGRVRGTEERASSNRRPEAASASRFGVRLGSAPWAPSRSARKVSRVISNRLAPACGGLSLAAARIEPRRRDGDQDHASSRGGATAHRVSARRVSARGARQRVFARRCVVGSSAGPVASAPRDLPQVVVDLAARGIDQERALSTCFAWARRPVRA
jgi:hypothetical protein